MPCVALCLFMLASRHTRQYLPDNPAVANPFPLLRACCPALRTRPSDSPRHNPIVPQAGLTTVFWNERICAVVVPALSKGLPHENNDYRIDCGIIADGYLG